MRCPRGCYFNCERHQLSCHDPLGAEGDLADCRKAAAFRRLGAVALDSFGKTEQKENNRHCDGGNHLLNEVTPMLPGHEIDRNLPLRKFFLALVDRAIQLSNSDAHTRRLLEDFANEADVSFEGTGWRSLARQVMFQSEVSKEMSYGLLAVKHFVEYLEYASKNPEDIKLKGKTEEFREVMDEVLNLAAKLASYANPTVLETFDFNNLYMEPVGQRNEPTVN